jgi:hypothetical protein
MVWQNERVLRTAVLFNIQAVINKLYNSAFVTVYIAIIRGRKYSDHSWKILRTIPVMHFEALKLGFMSP